MASQKKTRKAVFTDPKRKHLGQFFTGLPLARLLASLATNSAKNILDPMAGDGDLLEAAFFATDEKTPNLHGVEVDASIAKACIGRLKSFAAQQKVLTGDAFDPSFFSKLRKDGYDLVIANPPFVRRESRSAKGLNGTEHTREGLRNLVTLLAPDLERDVWTAVVDGYSGLADLSLPSFLLAALFVRPGGTLALVMPSTWRSRQYADVMRYVLLRFFSVEFVVEDTQPGWFSDAEIRSNLIVAKRLSSICSSKRLAERAKWEDATWITIAPSAASGHSLVGSTFLSKTPDKDFARWARDFKGRPRQEGLEVSQTSHKEDWNQLRTQARKRRWFAEVEGRIEVRTHERSALIPDALRDLFPSATSERELVTLDELGIKTGQGLRTGCNSFFYVTQLGDVIEGKASVRTSAVLGSQILRDVPAIALKPVLQKQSEIDAFLKGQGLNGRVLVLKNFVLPEDASSFKRPGFLADRDEFPSVMTEDLSRAIRQAVRTIPPGRDRVIPELSAVRTNSFAPRNSFERPRFWYQLPDFMPRHIPMAFVPRVNHGLPWVERNSNPPVVIDANFTTFWSTDQKWTANAIKAFLNSAWCRTFMEAAGTKFGGGALKLEAAHIREIPVPRHIKAHAEMLDRLGAQLSSLTSNAQESIDKLVIGSILGDAASAQVSGLARRLNERAEVLQGSRQKAA